jgi:hypothetical protein
LASSTGRRVASLAREQGRAGVAALVLARQARLGQSVREAIADEMIRRADRAGAGDDDGLGLGRNVADDDRYARLDDAGLFPGDARASGRGIPGGRGRST